MGGGPTEPLQTFDTETRLLARTTSDVLLSRKDADQPGVAHLLRMPIAGGTPAELVSYEEQEYRDSAARVARLAPSLCPLGSMTPPSQTEPEGRMAYALYLMALNG